MQTIQVVLDTKLLRATDRAAQHRKMNRSALIRDALRSYLRRMREKELEVRDRAGYGARDSRNEDVSLWEAEAVWPGD